MERYDPRRSSDSIFFCMGFEEAYKKMKEIINKVNLTPRETVALLQEHELPRHGRNVYFLARGKKPAYRSIKNPVKRKELFDSGKEKFEKEGYQCAIVKDIIALLWTREGYRVPVLLRRPVGSKSGELYLHLTDLGERCGEEVRVVDIECYFIRFDELTFDSLLRYLFFTGYIGKELDERNFRKVLGLYVPKHYPPKLEWKEIDIKITTGRVTINGIIFGARIIPKFSKLIRTSPMPLRSIYEIIDGRTLLKLERVGVVQVVNGLIYTNPCLKRVLRKRLKKRAKI